MCPAGYAATTVTRLCGDRGIWEAPSGDCARLRCLAVTTTSANGHVYNWPSTLAGTSATVQCSAGYHAGSATRACGADGQWAAAPGDACAAIVTCPADTTPVGPEQEAGDHVWAAVTLPPDATPQTVELQCETPQFYAGVVSRTCGSDGSWSAVSGACEPYHPCLERGGGHVVDGTTCDDGLAYTTGDACSEGTCAGHPLPPEQATLPVVVGGAGGAAALAPFGGVYAESGNERNHAPIYYMMSGGSPSYLYLEHNRELGLPFGPSAPHNLTWVLLAGGAEPTSGAASAPSPQRALANGGRDALLGRWTESGEGGNLELSVPSFFLSVRPGVGAVAGLEGYYTARTATADGNSLLLAGGAPVYVRAPAPGSTADASASPTVFRALVSGGAQGFEWVAASTPPADLTAATLTGPADTAQRSGSERLSGQWAAGHVVVDAVPVALEDNTN